MKRPNPIQTVLGRAGVLLLAGSSSFCIPAQAGVPESGIYVVEGAPERGVVIEHQDGVVSVMVFAYNERSGEPEWYIASGRLRDDAVAAGVGAEPPVLTQGYYPVHWFEGDLLKAKGGLCAVCYVPFRAPTYETAGKLALYVDFLGQAAMELVMPSETLIPQPVQPLRRLNVGYSRQPGEFVPVADLTGEWVFVDKADPARQPDRFRFGPGEFRDRTQETTSPQNYRPNSLYELIYRDPVAGAVLLCRSGFNQLPASVEPSPPGNGCELRVADEIRYSMLISDIGLGRIQAFRGPMPSAAGPALRGPLDIIALRLE